MEKVTKRIAKLIWQIIYRTETHPSFQSFTFFRLIINIMFYDLSTKGQNWVQNRPPK